VETGLDTYARLGPVFVAEKFITRAGKETCKVLQRDKEKNH
jgi:hypothetical protein